MNKIITNKINIILCLLMLLFSCENTDDFLTEINPNSVSPDAYWNSENDAVTWLTAAYSSLVYSKSAANAEGSNGNFNRFFAWASVYRSDEYRSNFGNPWGQANAEFTLDASNPVVQVLWDSFYVTIFRANTAIEQIPLIESIDEQTKNELLGEAQFLRGISYFYLINFWESIPLITSPAVDTEDFTPGQAPRADVWAQVITDLTDAKNNLQTIPTRDDAELGRATWGAAIGHLAKAYLYQEDWANAALEFRELIDSGIYDLVPNYRDNCNSLNENNIESIFEAQCDFEVSVFYTSWRARDGGPANFAANQGVVEPWLVNTFREEPTIDGDVDPRAQATLIFPHPDNILYGGITYEEAYGTLDPDAPAYWKKYRNTEIFANDSNGRQSSINDRIMKFGDVLLMYAEAENEANGPTADAQGAINRVRARARMAEVSASLSQDEFRTAVRRERVLELSGEDNRWMDLKRWGILEERFNDPNILSGKQFNISRHEYYPIPVTEIQANPNLVQYADY